MAFKGGYKIIDFKNNNLSTSATDGVVINGIYDDIENTYRKPLLFSGIVLEGIEKADVFASVTSSDNTFTVSLYGSTITIDNTDTVKVTA